MNCPGRLLQSLAAAVHGFSAAQWGHIPRYLAQEAGRRRPGDGRVAACGSWAVDSSRTRAQSLNGAECCRCTAETLLAGHGGGRQSESRATDGQGEGKGDGMGAGLDVEQLEVRQLIEVAATGQRRHTSF